MDEQKLKNQIGTNIADYRKRAGMTQAGLAEKLNYSDKAVSKWERGESVPDVLTMVQLAEQFDITVNELLADPQQVSEQNGVEQQAMGQVVEKTLKRKANKNVMLMLSSILVWFVALLFFVVVSSFGLPYSWLAFFVAIPVNAIVLLSLRSAWHDFKGNRVLISVIMWGCLVSFFTTMLALTHLNLWKVFLLGIPGQAAILLWFQMFRPSKSGEEEHG